ncbi:MAG: aminotransferase class V-fold PLP-dependent enzyme [Planctomycetota bacterium]|nr:aminotransferase class V-fold PLP-dependent enzyme [Planctomycetota bacterium]
MPAYSDLHADALALRAPFPALHRSRGGKPPIYFNNTCMTLRPQVVIDAIRRYYEEFPTCGGGRTDGTTRLHNWFQDELREHEARAREAAATLVNAASPDEIVWTRNASEALNIVAHGLALEPGDEILGSEREHNSNLVPWLEAERRLRERAGDPDLVVRRFFELREDGGFDLEKALAAITPRTKVLALGHASNLDGTVVPDDAIRTLAKRVHEVGGIFVLDGAQSVPHRRVDVQDLGVDFLAWSIHKMCGPTGMGALWGRYDLLDALDPFVVGGDTIADTWQDRVEYKHAPGRFEAGLQDYAGIVGTAPAIEFVRDTVGYDVIHERELALNTRLTERLAPLQCDHFWLLGPEDPAERGGVITMASHSGALINAIERVGDEEANVMVRRGMFCVNAYLHRRFDRTDSAKNNLRASVYFYNTLDECDVFADIVERIVKNPLDFMDDA